MGVFKTIVSGLRSPVVFADTSMVLKSFLESAVCMCSDKSKYSWMQERRVRCITCSVRSENFIKNYA